MEKLFKKYLIHLLFIIVNISCNEGPLQYPEPPTGWEDGTCQSLQIQSPINIPSFNDESLVIDNGIHATIKDLAYSAVKSASVAFDHSHKWTTKELDIGFIEIELNGTLYKYKLNSIHFHLYSEHRIDSKQYPMEMHIVHKNTNKTDKDNENLVVGVLFDYKNDKNNKFLDDMNLASEKNIQGANILSLIKKEDEFFYYKGSLTTVPCTENVNWIVFKDVKDMSVRQFSKFKSWIENSDQQYYGVGYGNARGIKRLSGRKIYLENLKKKEPSIGVYLLVSLPIATLFLYPINIFNYHLFLKNKAGVIS